ncbi:MAG: 5-formyltetrahydrofolate cyclo-ligase [Sphingobacteriia bacterium]|nr:5-formyltetrahydrofolate cyclo-ligase [Sphingobacteriia bacterium]
MENKEAIRKTYIFQRNKLSASEIEKKSVNILEKVLQQFSLENKKVALYFPVKNEVNILRLLSLVNAEFYLPVIQNNNKVLKFAKWNGKEDELKKGQYNILEPIKEEFAENLDYIFVPIVAFNNENYRIGYGKGYYDTTLEYFHKILENKPKLIGVAYKEQLSDFKEERHDCKLDAIITD